MFRLGVRNYSFRRCIFSFYRNPGGYLNVVQQFKLHCHLKWNLSTTVADNDFKSILEELKLDDNDPKARIFQDLYDDDKNLKSFRQTVSNILIATNEDPNQTGLFLKKSVELYPDDILSNYNYSQYIAQCIPQQSELLLNSYLKTVELAENCTDVSFNTSWILKESYLILGRYHLGIKYFEKSILYLKKAMNININIDHNNEDHQINRDKRMNFELYWLLGIYYRMQNNLNNSLKYLVKAETYLDTNLITLISDVICEDLYNSIAKLYLLHSYDVNKYEEYKHKLKNTMNKDFGVWVTYFWEGQQYLSEKKYEEAIKTYKQCQKSIQFHSKILEMCISECITAFKD